MTVDDLRALVEAAPAAELPRLIGDLEAAKAAAWTRLTTADSGGSKATADDENISASEAARRLGVSKVYLYRHAARLPFAVRIGRRVLFSARGLERWSRRQRVSA